MKRWANALVSRFSLRSKVRRTILSLDQEFQSHLEESVDDLIESGISPVKAQTEAVRRFGDLSGLRAAALSEHIIRPYRKLIYILAGVLLSTSAALVLSLYNIGNTLNDQREMKRVTGELIDLRARLAASGGRSPIPMAQDIRFVTVEGAVRNPQVWTLGRRNDVTLGDLLHRSGWLTNQASGQVVAVRLVNGEPDRVLRVDAAAETYSQALDTVIDGSYLIYAEPSSAADQASRSGKSGSVAQGLPN